MKLANDELHEALTEKGIKYLYHANTVATSTSFISAGGLLSRGDIERRNIFQTPQSSDNADKKFDVWSDVFLDAEDLHKKFSRQNHYGPVLFSFNIDLLLEDDLEVWVTKSNPICWKEGQAPEDRYFKSVPDLIQVWDEPNSQQRMFTIRKPERPISFKHLKKITLDDPSVNVHPKAPLSAGYVAFHALAAATDSYRSLRDLIHLRECNSRCYCVENYSNELSDLELAHLFFPRDLIHSLLAG